MDARKLALALAVISALELGIIVYLGGEVGVLRGRLENLIGSPVEVKLSETLIIHKEYPDEHVIRVVAVNMGLEDIERLEIKLTWMFRGKPVHQDSIVIENLAAATSMSTSTAPWIWWCMSGWRGRGRRPSLSSPLQGFFIFSAALRTAAIIW